LLDHLRKVFPSGVARRKAEDDAKREAEVARRALVRKARMMIQKLDGQIDGLEGKRRESHDAARTALAAGDRAAAHRHVQAARQKLLLIEKVEKQRFVFEHAAVMTEINVSEREMTDLMMEMARVNNLDPARIDTALQEVTAAIERGQESDDLWDMVSKDQMRSLGLAGSTVPSADKMLEDLASEVAIGIRAGTDRATVDVLPDPLKQRIGEGRARLTRLVDGLK